MEAVTWEMKAGAQEVKRKKFTWARGLDSPPGWQQILLAQRSALPWLQWWLVCMTRRRAGRAAPRCLPRIYPGLFKVTQATGGLYVVFTSWILGTLRGSEGKGHVVTPWPSVFWAVAPMGVEHKQDPHSRPSCDFNRHQFLWVSLNGFSSSSLHLPHNKIARECMCSAEWWWRKGERDTGRERQK